MSWLPKAVIIYGYKLSDDEFSQCTEICEENFCDEDWEEYLIETNPITGNGDKFFGFIVTEVDEDMPFARLGNIRANVTDILNLDDRAEKLYKCNCTCFMEKSPDYYVGVMYE